MFSFLKSSLQTRGLAILIPALGIIVLAVTLYLKHLNQTITAQVRALEINNEKLRKTADSLNLALKKRLSIIQTPSNTDKCETKLNFYETVLKEFNDEK